MKNNLKIFILIAFLTIAIHAPVATAAKRAIFPDSKSLQPMPPDAYANISGNINSNVGEPIIVPVDESTPQSPVTDIVVPNDMTASKTSYTVIWSIVIFLICIVMFAIYYKRNNKQ